MPKRKAGTESNTEESPSGDSPIKKAKAETKKPGSGRGRGRPRLPPEEVEKRAALKQAKKSGRGRGRPKGSKSWLAFSPWIRKPTAYTKSSTLFLKPPSSNTPLLQERKSAAESSSSTYDSHSDSSEVQNEAPSALLNETNTDRPKARTSNKDSPNEFLFSNNEISEPLPQVTGTNISTTLTKDFTKTNKKTHQSCNHQPSSLHHHKKSFLTLSQEESEVLKLEKEKLSIEIEVLHLKKKKLILQLEQMAPSLTPCNS